jgi:hypothetical protein
VSYALQRLPWPSGGLDTRTLASLMAGGNLRKVVIAGDAERSLLIHFIEGRRGEAHRMPIGDRTLSAADIDAVRRWIDEGARDDGLSPPDYTRSVNGVAIASGRPRRIFRRVVTPAYLSITVRDARNRKPLFVRVAAVEPPKEECDAGEPGDVLVSRANLRIARRRYGALREPGSSLASRVTISRVGAS